MRIGIDALFEARGASFEHLRHLLAEWERSGIDGDHEIVVFAGPFTSRRIIADFPKRMALVHPPMFAKGLLLRLVLEQTWLPLQLMRHNIDVVLCPANTVPLLTHVPTVPIFQNAAPFCDRAPRRVLGLRSLLRTFVLGLAIRASAQRATKVIFVSEYFRQLFESRFGFERHKGVVIRAAGLAPLPQGSPPTAPTQEAVPQAPLPFILTVSHLYPYKKILELVEGYWLMSRNAPDWNGNLVIVGAGYLTNYSERIKQLIARLGFREGEVVLTGALPHDEVADLMRTCVAFAFSSTCENCPMALVEALSAPAAIACSNVGVMPEIGGDAVIYFSPYEPEDIAKALGLLVGDENLRETLRAAARKRSQLFPDHAEVARRTFEVLADAAAP